MKNINLFIVVVLVILFSACTKEYITNITEIDTLTVHMDTLAVRLDTLNINIDSITIKLKNAGSLKVQIADNTGKTYPNTKIHLCTSYYISGSQISYSGEFDTRLTDVNGKANFKRVATGTYYLVTDPIISGSKKYIIARGVQVLSCDSTDIIINPLDYVGTINLHVNISTSYTDTLNRTTLKVALVNYNDYNSRDNRKKVISKAVDIQSCDANGDVVFKNIPSDIEYAAYVYINNTDTIGGWDYYYSVSKDNVTSGTVYVSMSSLFVVKASVTITLNYYSYSTYNYKPVQSAHVVLIKYSDYSNYSLYNASQSTILSYAVRSGITNTSGVVTLTNVPAYLDYYVYIYYDNLRYTWYSYVYPYPNSANNFSFSVTGSDLGLSK